ncbi:hypothetical protein SAMN05660313_01536 [Cellulophaga fucicola]|uniref:Uncharacterized protein n=1 Tax=Cellulophaga fucicola TaxID=76595 RepID=A0A1K1P1T2_9FLAO|nr:hypothetical protein SAMN05660313_01536 [Cellulophaga fucicola]
MYMHFVFRLLRIYVNEVLRIMVTCFVLKIEEYAIFFYFVIKQKKPANLNLQV